jgi:long-chain acyl-CoA synthetase
MRRIEQLLETLRSYSPHECIDADGRSYTYSDLTSGIAYWDARFDQLGVEPGDVVGIRADYSLNSGAALVALLLRRAVAALIPRDSAHDGYLQDSHARALLTVGTDGDYEWLPTHHPATHPLLERLRAAGDGGIVLFTSGSTGRPKAAVQSAERFLHKFRKPGRRFRTLAFLLFDHVAGLDTMFYTLVSGGTLILARRRDPASIASLIEKCRVEVLPVSPSFLRSLCLSASAHDHDLSSLKVITYGSEPMDPATLARLNARFPNVQITQKYGTTETGAPRTISRANDSLWVRFNSEGFETKVVDGVLWIRSESTLLGYLNAPSPVDSEGWYCTADLVDVDGPWIRFRGRASDTINVGGEKVTPAEVEQSILELDFVHAAAVCGAPHSVLGQIVTARVVLARADIDRKSAIMAIWQHCRERLAPYKTPAKIDIVTGTLSDARQKTQRKLSAHQGVPPAE